MTCTAWLLARVARCRHDAFAGWLAVVTSITLEDAARRGAASAAGITALPSPPLLGALQRRARAAAPAPAALYAAVLLPPSLAPASPACGDTCLPAGALSMPAAICVASGLIAVLASARRSSPRTTGGLQAFAGTRNMYAAVQHPSNGRHANKRGRGKIRLAPWARLAEEDGMAAWRNLLFSACEQRLSPLIAVRSDVSRGGLAVSAGGSACCYRWRYPSRGAAAHFKTCWLVASRRAAGADLAATRRYHFFGAFDGPSGGLRKTGVMRPSQRRPRTLPPLSALPAFDGAA